MFVYIIFLATYTAHVYNCMVKYTKNIQSDIKPEQSKNTCIC